MPNRKENIVKNKPMPCPECPKYAVCTAPCQEVELWITQDEVGRNSNLLLENGACGSYGVTYPNWEFLDMIDQTHDGAPEKDMELKDESWKKIQGMRLSAKVTRFIFSFYVMGKRIRDIAIDEGTSSQTIDRRHHQARVSIRNRMNKESDWINGRDHLEFKSIRNYDMAALFYMHHYPRRIIAKLVGVHSTTVIKYMSNQIKWLREALTSCVS